MAFGGRRDSSKRTAEDRAKAAAERAARRAQREGRPVPAPPPETFEHEVPPPEYREAPPPEPEPAYEPPPEPEPEPEPTYEPPPEPEPEPANEPQADHPQAYDGGRHDAELEPETDPRGLTAVQERPLPPRRVPAARRTAARPAPPRARTPGARQGSWRRRAGALLALLAIGAALYMVNATFQPFHGDGTGSVSIRIPEGADAGRIGEILAAGGVIDNATFFNLNATVTGRRGGLRPGDYTLRRDMSYGAAIEALSQGPKVKVVPTIDVTIPEGPSIRETAPLIGKTALEGNYAKAARERRVLRRVRRLGAPKGTRTAEGFLFPATYTLENGSAARALVDKQLDAFADNFREVDLAYAKRRNLTRYDVLIIASMVEREAQLDKERPLVASVIYNRLQEGMNLGIDATIRYDTRNWTRPIRQSELDDDTPYNTRLRPGLPPTPIGNPGLASMKAAAKPARTDYLYYVVKPNGDGEHSFSSSEAEFQRDYERYQASRGGP